MTVSPGYNNTNVIVIKSYGILSSFMILKGLLCKPLLFDGLILCQVIESGKIKIHFASYIFMGVMPEYTGEIHSQWWECHRENILKVDSFLSPSGLWPLLDGRSLLKKFRMPGIIRWWLSGIWYSLTLYAAGPWMTWSFLRRLKISPWMKKDPHRWSPSLSRWLVLSLS